MTTAVTDAIYEAIKSERAYQLRRWGRRTEYGFEETPHEIAAWALFMQDYLTEATRVASRSSDPTAMLEALRKVVTLGIACFEEHGVPVRPDGLVTNGHDGLPA